MKSKFRFKRFYAFTAIILVVLVFIYFYSAPSKHAKLAKNPLVTLSQVSKKNVVVRTQAIGTVQPYSTVDITSLVDGRLLEVGFKEGDTIQENQLLFTIDPRPYAAQLQQAEASLARDQAQLHNAQLALERNLPLAKKNYLSQQDLDQARANLASSAATVKADEAAITNAKLNLSYCTIKAPISGKTGNLLVYPGNVIKAASGISLVTINQITPIYVSFSLPEQQLSAIQAELKQGPIPILAVINKNKAASAKGVLSFVNNTIDSTTGTIQLKAVFANKTQQLWPGQLVTVEVPLQSLSNALVVPTIAVQAGPQGSYLYVIDNNKAFVRPIQLGPAIGEETVITEGVKEGEQVVTSGQLRLVDGAQVEIVPAHSSDKART